MPVGEEPRQRGFTYLALLWWVAISGVMLAALGSQWRMDAARQREAELVFRGEQIQAALRAYQSNTPAGQPTSPESLAELLDDRRQGPARRHLRKVWIDPVQGRPWELLLDANGRIRGVHSGSRRKPLSAPEGVDTYREWLFDVPVLPAQPIDGAPAAASNAAPPGASIVRGDP